MTRGTGYLVTDEYIYTHDEFNGDMYRDGHGQSFLETMDKVNVDNFDVEIGDWNSDNHDYSDFRIHKEKLIDYKCITKNDDIIMIDFNNNYFEYFFSDWIFFKNGSTKNIHFITRTDLEGIAGERLVLKPNESIAIKFGYEEDAYRLGD